jgi:hypothetical protein
VLGLVMFALFLGSKPPYILLLGAFLLPLFGAGFWVRVRDAAVACVPVLLWVVLISAFVVVPFGKPPYHPGPLYAGDHSVLMDHTDPAANLHILLAQPSRFFTLPWHTLSLFGMDKIHEMVGVLGVLQISLPEGYREAWYVAGALALAGVMFVRRPVAAPGVALVSFAWISGLVLLTYWLMMIVFYLNWSNVGIDFIDGMQGRYSLPLLPFLLLAVPGVRARIALPPLVPALPVIALGVVDIGYLPIKLVWNYYLH